MTARSLDIIMALGAALALLLGGFAGFAEECDEIPSEVLRLHIPAECLKLVSAIIVAIAIASPYIKRQIAFQKKKRAAIAAEKGGRA